MHWWDELLGAGKDIPWWAMCLRALMVFAAGLARVRIGGQRTFGKSSAYDTVVAVMMGSLLARTVTGNAALVPTVAAATSLMVLHWIVGKLAFRSHAFGHAVKGVETELVKDGEIQWGALKKANITSHDLQEAARLHGIADIGQVRSAWLERSGLVSVLRWPERPPGPA